MKMVSNFLIFSALMGSVSIVNADEIFHPSHGGEELKKSGLSYEVVRKPKEIIVYAPKEDAPVPNVITLKFKNKKGVLDQVELKLLPMKEQGNNIYSAPVPASVYIAGGLKFDLNFSKKK